MKTSQWQRIGPLGVITLSAPKAASDVPAFADPDELAAWLSEADLKGAAICGEGNRFFTGPGTEPSGGQRGRKEPARRDGEGARLLDVIESACVPTVAAVRGECLGPGLEIALSCLFRVAGKSAVFGFPGAAAGAMPGPRGTARLAGAMSRPGAFELLRTGRTIGAAEAEAGGLVHSVAEDGRVLDESLALLGRLTSHLDPQVVHAVMKALNSGLSMPRGDAMRLSADIFCGLARGIARP